MTSLSYYRTPALTDANRVVGYLPSPPFAPDQEHVFTFPHYLSLLQRNWWKIALAVVLSTGFAAFVSFRIPPVYQATARLSVDPRGPATVLGEDTVQNGSSDFDQLINTELQIIQSDAVLRPVAEKYHLSEIRKNASSGAAEAPIVLHDLNLTRVPNSHLIDIKYRSADPRLAASIANAVAYSYINRGEEMRATVSLELSGFMEKQIAELKQNMENSAQALAVYERQLGVIDPDQRTSILTSRLQQLNSQYIDAENDRIRKETDYKAIASGSDAALEVSPQAVALNALDERVRAAQEKMEQAKTIYGPGYSQYKRAANDLAEVARQDQELRAEISKRINVEFQEAQRREAMLRASVAATKAESDELNARSFQYEQLKREAEANTTLYNELYRKIKEAGINAGFQNSSIRIADEARPPAHPIFPNKSLFIFLGFMLSLLASMAVVLLAEICDKSLRDPEQAQQITGLSVLGSLPDVKYFPSLCLPREADRDERLTKRTRDRLVSRDYYRECVASILSSLVYGPKGTCLRSIVITSPGPSEGKSSCAANLAAAHAAQGKKTLLVDADLRCPSQHRYFGVANEGGIGGMIENALPLQTVRQKVADVANLDLIVAGITSKEPAALVGQKVSELIAEGIREYDLILIDAPPMLQLAEPIQIACRADGVVLVSHAGHTSRQEAMVALATLRSVHANIVGLILNRVHLNLSYDYRRYRAYKHQSGRFSTAKAV